MNKVVVDEGHLMDFVGNKYLGVKPSHEFGEAEKVELCKMIKEGIGRSAAAHSLGFSGKTVMRHMELDEEFREAVEESEEIATDEVEGAFYNNATRGRNVIAQQAWLYNRRSRKWRDARGNPWAGSQMVNIKTLNVLRISDSRAAGSQLGSGTAPREIEAIVGRVIESGGNESR